MAPASCIRRRAICSASQSQHPSNTPASSLRRVSIFTIPQVGTRLISHENRYIPTLRLDGRLCSPATACGNHRRATNPGIWSCRDAIECYGGLYEPAPSTRELQTPDRDKGHNCSGAVVFQPAEHRHGERWPSHGHWASLRVCGHFSNSEYECKQKSDYRIGNGDRGLPERTKSSSVKTGPLRAQRTTESHKKQTVSRGGRAKSLRPPTLVIGGFADVNPLLSFCFLAIWRSQPSRFRRAGGSLLSPRPTPASPSAPRLPVRG